MRAKKAKVSQTEEKVREEKLLKKLAYCEGHRGVNRMFGSGLDEPTETDWPLEWSDRCGTCRNNLYVAAKALKAGKLAAKR